MKSIFDGRIIISIKETDDKDFIATLQYKTKNIESEKSNREYAAIGDVINKFKKEIIKEI